MGDFFHGWRRKVGFLTLTMACALMGVWFRSLVIQDWYLVGWPNQTSRPLGRQLVTMGNDLVWFSSTARYGFVCSREKVQSRMQWIAGWHSRSTDDDFDPTVSSCVESGSVQADRWQFCGFETGGSHGYNTRGGYESFCYLRISYLSLVIPLTLISAGLLMSRPRPAHRSSSLTPDSKRRYSRWVTAFASRH